MTPIKSLELIDGLLTAALAKEHDNAVPAEDITHVRRVVVEQTEMYRLGLFGEAGE